MFRFLPRSEQSSAPGTYPSVAFLTFRSFNEGGAEEGLPFRSPANGGTKEGRFNEINYANFQHTK